MDNTLQQDVTSQAESCIAMPIRSESAHSQEPTTSATLVVSDTVVTPRQVLSKEQWENLRPLITRLYIDENKTFKSVAAVLRELHNFVPTYVSISTFPDTTAKVQ